MSKANILNVANGEVQPILVISGPTASGKSRLALALAERLAGEIINADSMQVYRDLSILTGRPSPEDEARVPHHLYGSHSVSDSSSVGIWLKAAVTVIEKVRNRNHLPIVCGGTGLYLKVLCEGLAPVPKVPAHLVALAGELYDSDGAAAFHDHLREIDPMAADRLPPTDRQRLIRAYTVRQATGRTLDNWKSMQTRGSPVKGPFYIVNLKPPREDLYDRINQRLLKMIELGALSEVRRLDPSLGADIPALKALGVPEFRSHIDGLCCLEEAIERSQKGTRNFAKRQATWFRNNLTANLLFEGFGECAEDIVIHKFLEAFDHLFHK